MINFIISLFIGHPRRSDFLDTSTWIAIYLPIIVLFLIILPSENRKAMITRFHIKKKGGTKMSSELIKTYIGRECNIATGTFGTSFTGVKIVEVVDNWMKITGKNKVDLVNIEYITSIKILPEKN